MSAAVAAQANVTNEKKAEPAAAAAGAVHPVDVPGDGKRVLVTGASGYIAGFVVALLQARGYRVRGTVRSLKKTEDVEQLKRLTPPDAKYPQVELVEADLLEYKGWPAAVSDCHYVIHCASPFIVDVPKDENVLIKPAVAGTINVLRALALSKPLPDGHVKRCVLTSSSTAVNWGHSAEKVRSTVFSEEDWSDETDLAAYPKSKTRAEKAAWRFMHELYSLHGQNQSVYSKHKAAFELKAADAKAQAPLTPDLKKEDTALFELTVINPNYVQGPVVTNKPAASNTLIQRFLADGFPGVPRVGDAVVDVRDVALAHVRAMRAPSRVVVGNRYLLSAGWLWYGDYARILAAEFDSRGYSIKQMAAPKAVLWLASKLWDEQAGFILPLVDVEKKITVKAAERDLGMVWRPAPQTIIEHAYSLIKYGLAPNKLPLKKLDKDGNFIRWEADSTQTQCRVCKVAFGVLTRRHHCNFCGLIFCDACSSQKVKGERACKSCYEKETGTPAPS